MCAMKFNDIEMKENIARAIEVMGFDEMTKIQEKAIPVLREGRDVIGRSQTGTGKTMAFAIPAAELVRPKLKAPQVLVLLPTRELALQVAGEFEKLLQFIPKVKVCALFGGAPMDKQFKALNGGAQVVVGTPGRIMDHLRRGSLILDHLAFVVLDEADEMLDMGFREDIETILNTVDHPVQMALFSATIPEEIRHIAESYQTDPVRIEIAPQTMVASGIEQKYFNIADESKFEALTRLLDVYKPNRAMIFCNTKMFVDDLVNNLQENGYAADKIHGDMRQEARLAVLERFSSGRLQILVATDVAARGIDVENVDIVFNYDVPDNEEYYIHRIGRTGRAGKQGLSLTLARRRDRFRLQRITALTKKEIERAMIPGGEEINAMKMQRFKERFVHQAEDPVNIEKYLKVIDDLSEDYEPRFIAAVLLGKLLPLTDARDLNVHFDRERKQRKVKEGKERRRQSESRQEGKHYNDPLKTRRIRINLGKTDGIRKGDVLGALCNECGISSAEVGHIEMMPKQTFVDVDARLAPKITKRLTGKYLKNKKITAELIRGKR